MKNPADQRMTTLYLVRHGQTDWNEQRRWQGHCDVPLNEAGRRQAEALARAFERVPVDRVLSSDLGRARDTAVQIAQATGAPLTVLPALRERAFGRWEGHTNEEILREFPEEMAEYHRNRDTFVPPGGQSWVEFAAGAVAAFDSLDAEYPGERLAVVAHGGPLKAFINQVLGIERGPLDRFALDNGSISSVVRRKHRMTGVLWWQIVALNVTCHLHLDGPSQGAAPA